MKKLIWMIDESLDGFMSGPNGEMNWVGADMSPELWSDVNNLLRRIDTVLFGRKTYEDFERYWRAAAQNPASSENEIDFSKWINESSKFVASRTRQKFEWRNSALLPEPVVDQIATIKQQSGKDALMFGSRNLALQLMEAGLIDEMQLRIHPLFLGRGQRLFTVEAKAQRATLLEAKAFPGGVVRSYFAFQGQRAFVR